jgi:hypothetical protein
MADRRITILHANKALRGKKTRRRLLPGAVRMHQLNGLTAANVIVLVIVLSFIAGSSCWSSVRRIVLGHGSAATNRVDRHARYADLRATHRRVRHAVCIVVVEQHDSCPELRLPERVVVACPVRKLPAVHKPKREIGRRVTFEIAPLSLLIRYTFAKGSAAVAATRAHKLSAVLVARTTTSGRRRRGVGRAACCSVTIRTVDRRDDACVDH